MKRWLGIALGIVTSVGGFLEIGSITTAAQAGADYRYQLAWVIVLGTLCIALLVEMAGRFAAVSKHTIASNLTVLHFVRSVSLCTAERGVTIRPRPQTTEFGCTCNRSAVSR